MKTFRSNTNRTWIAFASFSPERMQLKQDICLLSWQPRFSPQDLEMGWNSLAAYLTVLIAIVTMIWVVNYSCATTTEQVRTEMATKRSKRQRDWKPSSRYNIPWLRTGPYYLCTQSAPRVRREIQRSVGTLNYLPKYRATTVNKNGSTAQCQRPKIRHWFFLENAIHNGNHAIPMLELVSCSNGQV